MSYQRSFLTRQLPRNFLTALALARLTLQELLNERDSQAKALILEYEKIKKKVGRAIQENPGDVFLIDHPKV